MNLREQIASIIYQHENDYYRDGKFSDGMDRADSILALPTGLEVVKKCENCNGTGSAGRAMSFRDILIALIDYHTKETK